jgi:fucose 4-O-acetylase-like acetyltransferase
MEKTRLQYIDALKGFLIITVVAGHIVQSFHPNGVNNHLFRLIYSFHMPLFMFVSGFVCYRQPNRQLKLVEGIKRRFIQLMLPFLVWSFMVSPLVLWDWDVHRLLNRFLYPDRGLWFLWVLFFIYAIFISLSKIAEKLKFNQSLVLMVGAVALFSIYLISNFRFFGFQFIAWYFMFFTIGFLYHQYNEFVNMYLKYLFAISLLVFPILAWHWQMKIPPVIFGFSIRSNMWLYIYKFISVVFAIPFFMYLFKFRDGKFNVLPNIGRNTMGIYAMHFLFINFFIRPVHTYTNTLTFYIFLIAAVVLLILLCMGVIYWIRKASILKLLLLGEKNKNDKQYG